jgi:hypothetical protein
MGDVGAWQVLWNTPGIWRPDRPEWKPGDGCAWPYLRLTPAALVLAFPPGMQVNIGVNLGEASSGLCDIDCDCPEVIALADLFLPTDTAIFGRASKRRSHRLFYAAGAATEQFKDPLPDAAGKFQMLVELRATPCGNIGKGVGGSQTVLPPSVHTSGESIEWEPGHKRAPKTVDAAELRSKVAALAAAALVARHAGMPAALAMAEGAGLPPTLPAAVILRIRDWLHLELPPTPKPKPQPPTEKQGMHLGTGGGSWFDRLRADGPHKVAELLGYESNEERRLIGTCPACGDEQRSDSDRRWPVTTFQTADGSVLLWKHHKCGECGDAVAFAAHALEFDPKELHGKRAQEFFIELEKLYAQEE